MTDHSAVHSELKNYLTRKGIEITSTDADRIRCLSGSHPDNLASMIVYEEILHCPVCATNMDIFEAAGMIENLTDFPAKKAEVYRVLGIQEEAYAGRTDARGTKNSNGISGSGSKDKPDENRPSNSDPERGNNRQKITATPVPVTNEQAKEIFNLEKCRVMGKFALHFDKPGVSALPMPSAPEKRWAYRNAAGMVEILEARFHATDFLDGKKKYIAMYWNGSTVKTSGCPVVLLNRDKLAQNPDMPVVWHEGPKCAQEAEKIPGFIHVCFNSGGKKYENCDWSPLAGREVFLYPDDDEPGRTTGRAIAKHLKSIAARIKICEPHPEARAKKASGADIVEALMCKTPEEMAEYIKNCPGASVLANQPSNDRNSEKKTRPNGIPENSDTDSNLSRFYRILGTADDGYTYFIDRHESLQKEKLRSLNKGLLMTFAPLSSWATWNPGKSDGINWDQAIDDIIQCSGKRFDTDNLRGIGAWREPDGRICYNNGEHVVGRPDNKRVYLKLSPHEIGLDCEPAPVQIRRAMLDAAGLMSFETKADCVRLLGWSVIAPFGGALEWRPAGYITGESESGKTTAVNFICKKLAAIRGNDIISGGESSGAGVRQHGQDSSKPMIVEESEEDTPVKKKNKDEVLSIMRQSTSDDAPKALKGSQDGRGAVSYAMRKTFMFVGINPLISSAADENRISRINMVPGKGGDWKAIKASLRVAFTEENCKAVQAFVWQNLPDIISKIDWFTDIIESSSSHSVRYAGIEAILFSAFWLVFMGKFPDEAELIEWLTKMYAAQTPDVKRNEASEMINLLLEQIIDVNLPDRRKMSIHSMLRALKTGELPAADSVYGTEGVRPITEPERLAFLQAGIDNGVGVHDGNLAIFKRSGRVAVHLGLGERNLAYTKLLRRHPNLIIDGKIVQLHRHDIKRNVIVFGEVLESDEIPF